MIVADVAEGDGGGKDATTDNEVVDERYQGAVASSEGRHRN